MSELKWDEVVSRFARARNWWVCTSGSGGPHTVPIWGVALDERLTFWGSPTTIRSRNLAADPRLVLHLEDGEDPLILHGNAVAKGLANEDVDLVQAFRSKYRSQHDQQYLPGGDYAADAIGYEVVPTKALAWEVVALENWTIRRWPSAAIATAVVEP